MLNVLKAGIFRWIRQNVQGFGQPNATETRQNGQCCDIFSPVMGECH